MLWVRSKFVKCIQYENKPTKSNNAFMRVQSHDRSDSVGDIWCLVLLSCSVVLAELH